MNWLKRLKPREPGVLRRARTADYVAIRHVILEMMASGKIKRRTSVRWYDEPILHGGLDTPAEKV